MGVNAVDMSREVGQRNFTLRAMLIMTINDFPAYTLISGQVGKGYAGCPVCGEETCAEYSNPMHKMLFFGNRRFLRPNHVRRAATGSVNNMVEDRPAPARQSGLTIVQRGAWRASYLDLGGRRDGPSDPVKVTGVKRVSSLYELPYWRVS